VMHQPVENTAFCLNCTYEWPATWDINELTLTCIECRWLLAVPINFVLWGWWTVQEQAESSGK
jgi:hypothetical protein